MSVFITVLNVSLAISEELHTKCTELGLGCGVDVTDSGYNPKAEIISLTSSNIRETKHVVGTTKYRDDISSSTKFSADVKASLSDVVASQLTLSGALKFGRDKMSSRKVEGENKPLISWHAYYSHHMHMTLLPIDQHVLKVCMYVYTSNYWS